MKQRNLIDQSSLVKSSMVDALSRIRSYLLEESEPVVLSWDEKEMITNRFDEVQKEINMIKNMVKSDDDYNSIIKHIEYSRRALHAAEVLLLESHSVPLQ